MCILVTPHRDDLSFQNPVGICLGRAPRIDSDLFVGRKTELAEMGTMLQPKDSRSKQRRLVFRGQGGMGKIQLALAFAARFLSGR